MRLFALYFLIEAAVMVALVYTIGFGWTILAILATFVVGVALAGSQVARHIGRLQSALNSRSASTELATDSALVALGAVLVVMPGLASSLLGALLLLPPTRRIARPVATALVGRRLAAAPMVMTYTTRSAGFRPAHRPVADYVDGEVIGVVDISDMGADTGADPSGNTGTRDGQPTALDRRVTGAD